jgi:hypothetical protein
VLVLTGRSAKADRDAGARARADLYGKSISEWLEPVWASGGLTSWAFAAEAAKGAAASVAPTAPKLTPARKR